MKPPAIATFRFYEELNDFLPKEKRKRQFEYCLKLNQTVKDAIEAIGVPHTEVDLIIINGESAGFAYHPQHADFISVYPVFESFNIKSVVKLRPKPLRVTKFVLDVHLGKLCKYLRMLGFDTFYHNHLEDSEIIKISITQKRIILTRDIGILKNGKVTHGYWLRSQNPREQIQEVIKRFDLLKDIKPFNRCTVCNGLVRNVDKEKVTDLLEPGTKKYYHQFFQCESCLKIYWEGSHYEKMNTFIEDVVAAKKPQE